MNDQARVPDPAELLELLQDTVFVCDENSVIRHVNSSCQHLVGYRPAELLGTRMIDYVHPEDRDRTLSRVWQIMAGVSATRFRNRWLHKNGHAVEIDWAVNWSERHRMRVATGRAVEAPEG